MVVMEMQQWEETWLLHCRRRKQYSLLHSMLTMRQFVFRLTTIFPPNLVVAKNKVASLPTTTTTTMPHLEGKNVNHRPPQRASTIIYHPPINPTRKLSKGNVNPSKKCSSTTTYPPIINHRPLPPPTVKNVNAPQTAVPTT